MAGNTLTKPANTERSKGSATSNPLSTGETGLSTSDTRKLAEMFPDTPYVDGYGPTEVLDAANRVLHPRVQPGVAGWSVETNLDFFDADALDQTDHGSDLIPPIGYAPSPKPDDPTMNAVTPPGFNPDLPTDNLKKPKEEGPKIYRTIGDTLKQGVKIVRE